MAIYDTMEFIPNDVSTVAIGLAASMGQFLLCAGAEGQALRHPARADHDAPALRRHRRYGGDIAIQAEQMIHTRSCCRTASRSTPARRSSRSKRTPTATAGSPLTKRRTMASSTTSLPEPLRCRAPARSPRDEELQGDPDEHSRCAAQSRYVLPNFIERTSRG